MNTYQSPYIDGQVIGDADADRDTAETHPLMSQSETKISGCTTTASDCLHKTTKLARDTRQALDQLAYLVNQQLQDIKRQIDTLRVDALTEGIRSFTTSPYIFMSLAKARELLSVPSDQATFYLVKVPPGVAVSGVTRALETKLPGTSIFTKAEFRQTNLDYWLFGTGAGVALLGGAVLGLIIGTVVVAQTLYSSTKDHLAEFATLRALGSSSFYIHKVILTQATVSAFLGYALGIAVSFAVAQASLHTPMPIMLTPQLAAMLLVVTVVMCAVSALSSIFKVTKIDPAMVFAR
jgi:putative ABC transport system permease protein